MKKGDRRGAEKRQERKALEIRGNERRKEDMKWRKVERRGEVRREDNKYIKQLILTLK